MQILCTIRLTTVFQGRASTFKRFDWLISMVLVTHHSHARKFSYRFSGSVYQTLYKRYTGLIDQAKLFTTMAIYDLYRWSQVKIYNSVIIMPTKF